MQTIGHDIGLLIAAARAGGGTALSEVQSKAFLIACGIPVPDGCVVTDAADAGKALLDIGPPCVVKAVSAQLTHKTEAGGVIFPVETPEAAEDACRTIARRVAAYRSDITLDGFLVEAYRPAQPEWILALRNDPHFGATIMFGLGGVYVEVLRQVSFRLAPLAERDIEALITDNPAMRILDGLRGRPAADRAALKSVIRKLSDLSLWPGLTEISEIEINPLAVSEHGAFALDALITLRS